VLVKLSSNIPTYAYTLVATFVIGIIIVSSCALSMANLKNEAENQQLTNIAKYVATQSLILLAHQAANNQNVTQLLQVPTQVGNQIYWISIGSDSGGAWVQTGFGTTLNPSQPHIPIPAKTTASGFFVSTFGRAFLQYCSNNQTAILTLISE